MFKVELELTTEMLGTVPKDPEVYRAHVQSKAADLGDEKAAEELATVEHVEGKGWTGFHMLDGEPIIYNYLIKGFFKEACGMLRQVPGSYSSSLTSYKKKIDGLVFVSPRQIRLELPEGGEMGVNERPLRAQTAQGERVALARSDTYPAGTRLVFTVNFLASELKGRGGKSLPAEDLLREWLDYGALKGLGQWRSAGWGSFTYTLKKET